MSFKVAQQSCRRKDARSSGVNFPDSTLDVGEVTGKERYNVTYNASGRNPTLHPELRRFKHPCSGDARAAPQLMRPRITLDDIQELLLVSA